jgi:hypothetical protein
MSAKTQNYFEKKIVWKQGVDALYPYVADFEGEQRLIRINDFPDEHLYTLIVQDCEVANFDDWPQYWTRPKEEREVSKEKKREEDKSSTAALPGGTPLNVVV